MDVLILGGAGYLGTVLATQALRADYRVNIVDNLLYDQGQALHHFDCFDKCRITVGDVRDVESYRRKLERADVVIHLAALVGAPTCEQHKEMATEVNRDSVANVVKLLSHSQRFLFPNTNSGYGTVAAGQCTEETPMNPISHYGVTKMEAETIALSHPMATVLRLATVFGVSPRMRLDLLVNTLTYRAYFDKEIKVFDGDLRRNYVHVQDVARAFLWLFDKQFTFGQVYNLGDDAANMTKLALAKRIARLADAAVVPCDGADPDRRDYLVSSAKLAKAGFVTTNNFDMGIRELLDWCRTLPAEPARREAVVERMSTTCAHR